MTISVPPAMAKQMEQVQKEEHRTRSELLREAWRHYFESRGNFVTLEQLRDELASANRKPRTKSARKASR